MTQQDTQPPAETLARAERLKYYPDYIDDPDGLARFRRAVETNSGHDMAAVNHNSLGRLIDTIERLRFERDTALAATPKPPAGGDARHLNELYAIYRIALHRSESSSVPVPEDMAEIAKYAATVLRGLGRDVQS